MENETKKKWTKEQKVEYLEKEIERVGVEILRISDEIEVLKGSNITNKAVFDQTYFNKVMAIKMGAVYMSALKKRLDSAKTI